MIKDLRHGLAESAQDWRHIARTRQLLNGLERDRRGRQDQLDEMDWLDRERAKLSRQLLEATTTIEGGTRSAYVPPHEVAAIRQQIEVIDARLRRLYTAPAANRGVLRKLAPNLKVELSVIGHQLLLILGIVIANIVFFGLLIWVFPYVWNWFWSFP